MQFVFDLGIGVADDDAHIAAVGGHLEIFSANFGWCSRGSAAGMRPIYSLIFRLLP